MDQARPMGAVELALQDQLFGRFTTVENEIAVGVTPVLLLRNNPERIGWIIVNIGTQTLTFRGSRSVASGAGFILVNNGDTAATTYLEDGQFPTHELSIVSAAAGGLCFASEFIRDAV